jgi:hypothetical protein
MARPVKKLAYLPANVPAKARASIKCAVWWRPTALKRLQTGAGLRFGRLRRLQIDRAGAAGYTPSKIYCWIQKLLIQQYSD